MSVSSIVRVAAKRAAWVLLIAGIVSLIGLALWFVPAWEVQQGEVNNNERRLELVNQYRTTLAQIIGGFALLFGLYLTWRRITATEEGQITERFTRAIDQLGAINEKGEKKLEIRLGGIYALERIARDSPRKDHWQIMEILTAYVRENASWKDDDEEESEETSNEKKRLPKLPTDIQAVLTVLGRRIRAYEKADQSLDLTRTNLRGANLKNAHLEGAHLTGALLEGADLTGATGLTAERFQRAITDKNTKLPEYLNGGEKPEQAE